jgi:hypothetical protein
MLPKIEHPMYTIQIPSNKKKHNFRPFLVKEEKLLLMAKEGDESDILRAIKQIVNNCCIDNNFNVNDISITDLSYLYIRLRSISVNNKVKQTYIDMEDNKSYTVEIDLDKVEVVQDNVVTNIVKITPTMGIILRHPPANLLNEEEFEDDVIGSTIITYCIEKVYENDEIFLANDYKKEELAQFIENLPVPALETINEFLDNAPYLKYTVEYTNSMGTVQKFDLRTLNDFFYFR